MKNFRKNGVFPGKTRTIPQQIRALPTANRACPWAKPAGRKRADFPCAALKSTEKPLEKSDFPGVFPRKTRAAVKITASVQSMKIPPGRCWGHCTTPPGRFSTHPPGKFFPLPPSPPRPFSAATAAEKVLLGSLLFGSVLLGSALLSYCWDSKWIPKDSATEPEGIQSEAVRRRGSQLRTKTGIQSLAGSWEGKLPPA